MDSPPPILEYRREPRRRVPISRIILSSIGIAFYGALALFALAITVMFSVAAVMHLRENGIDVNARMGILFPVLLWLDYRVCKRVWTEIQSIDPRRRIIIERREPPTSNLTGRD